MNKNGGAAKNLGRSEVASFDVKVGPLRIMWWRHIKQWPPYLGTVYGEGRLLWIGPLWLEV